MRKKMECLAKKVTALYPGSFILQIFFQAVTLSIQANTFLCGLLVRSVEHGKHNGKLLKNWKIFFLQVIYKN